MFSSNHLGSAVEAIQRQGLAIQADLQAEQCRRRLIVGVQNRTRRYVYSPMAARLGAWMQHMGERLQAQTPEPKTVGRVRESDIQLAR